VPKIQKKLIFAEPVVKTRRASVVQPRAITVSLDASPSEGSLLSRAAGVLRANGFAGTVNAPLILEISVFKLTASLISERTTMASGTVKWFNSQKGYGFIQPDDGGKDVFIHISAVERAGLGGLNEGQKIKYEVQMDRGKASAGNLSVSN
jgi:CspA family cold shock protein